MTADERSFLQRLVDADRPVTRTQLPLADRKTDRIRQRCRKAGLCLWKSVKGSRSGWTITPAGRAALAAQPGERP